MAQIRNSLSMKLKGRAGAYTFYSSKGRQIARVSQNSTNYGESARRSLAQQERRVRWANLVNFWKGTSALLRGAFESKRSNESDYNAFMRKNLPGATVALTKDMAAAGCCAPQTFMISEGSLPSPDFKWFEFDEDTYASIGINAANSVTYTALTIAKFTEDVLAANTWMKEGMQITIIVGTPTPSAQGPRFGLHAVEITLSKSDTRVMSSVLGAFGLETDDNELLYITNMSTDSYWAVIVSDSTSGQLKVSSATLIQGDSEFEEELSTPEAVAAAVQSYGLDPDRFLDSGDYNP